MLFPIICLDIITIVIEWASARVPPTILFWGQIRTVGPCMVFCRCALVCQWLPQIATAIPALLLRPFETVLQGRVCTQTNHACLGHALTQCTPSMGRPCRQRACPWQRLLCKFALGLRGPSWQTLEPMETASAWHGVLAASALCPNATVSFAALLEKRCLHQSLGHARWSRSWTGSRCTLATRSKSSSPLALPLRRHPRARPRFWGGEKLDWSALRAKYRDERQCKECN